MEGRTEREIVLENKLLDKLNYKPKWMQDFYYYIGISTAATTKEAYLRYVSDFSNYCQKEFGKDSIELEDFQQVDTSFMNKYLYSLINRGTKKNGASIVNARISAISKFFRFLISNRVVNFNPCDGLERPKIPKKSEIVYLELNEIKDVEDCIQADASKWKERDQLLIDLPLYTGIRISAMLDVNLKDIDLQNGTLRVTEKRNKERIFTLAPDLVQEFKAWISKREKIIEGYKGDLDALFITIYGGICRRISVVSANNVIAKYTKNVPKHITAHKLRATMATTVYNQTEDLYAVSCALGHEDTKTTKRYVDDKGKGEKKAASAMADIMKNVTN